MTVKKKTGLKRKRGVATKLIDKGTKATTEEPSSTEQNKAIEVGGVKK